MTLPGDPKRAVGQTNPVDPVDAEPAIVEGCDPPSQRQPLDRARIILAAMTHVDEQGLTGLSMRRLGAALEVEAMSLYRHVASKEDLLDALVESLIADMRTDDAVFDRPQHGWQDFLQRLAHGIRRIALAHPQAFPLVASRPPQVPWLRPPLRSIEWVEIFLSGMVSEGFSDEAAVHAYRAFTAFLLGHLLLEASVLGADIDPLDEPDDTSQFKPLPRAPLVTRLRPQLAVDHSAAEFEAALEQLLDRFTLLKSQQ